MPNTTPESRKQRHRRGLSLVEMLISLAITALLLTATMIAINASFHAYAVAAESASTQTSTRMVVNRVLSLIRTSTAHGPLEPDLSPGIPQAIKDFFPDGTTFDTPPAVTLDQGLATVTSPYLEVINPDGDLIRIQYLAGKKQLFVVVTPYGTSDAQAYPLLGGVTRAQFNAVRRTNDTGLLVLQRASMDLKVEPDKDSSLAIEAGGVPAVRLVASTMPRKLQ